MFKKTKQQKQTYETNKKNKKKAFNFGILIKYR